MASVWTFGCELGLSQDNCGEHEKDEDSRGVNRFAGCPSCIHRVPHNSETQAAENAWANKEVIKD